MNFKTIFIAVLALTFAGEAFAQSNQRLWRDIKLPTQRLLERQVITNPAAAGTTDVLSANAGNTSASAASVTSFVAQPDVPRNLVITPGTSTVDVAACTITVSGTDYFGDSISEGFAFSNNASGATTGSKAFKTVSSVSFPAGCEDGNYAATWSIGYGEKLGLKRCMTGDHIVFSSVAGTYEATRPTVAYSSTVISSNTADFNGTMNGSNDIETFFVQSHEAQCQP